MYAPEPSFPDAEHRGSGREARPYLVSSPGESHPRALAEPYVTVSRHTAPTGQLRMRENAPSASVHPSALPRAGWLRADLTCPAPFAPAPLQGLHRYYGPVRPCASRYSVSCGVCRLRVSLSRPGGNLRPIRLAVGSEATGSPIPCQRLRRAHATYTPGHHHQGGGQGCPLAEGHALGVALSRRRAKNLRFRCHLLGLSMRQQWYRTCSSSRRSPDPLVAGLLPQRSPRGLLTARSLRWFGLSACTANPEGRPPSLAQQASSWRSSAPALGF